MLGFLRIGIFGGWCVLALTAAREARAQVALVVQHEGKPHLVRMVKRGYCVIEVDGKREEVSRGAPLALVPVSQFRPVVVKVRDFQVNGYSVSLSSEDVGTMTMNKSIEFRGTFESPVQLENVFAVVECESDGERRIFYQEIGTLAPRQPTRKAVRVPLAKQLGRVRVRLHVMADGTEVLHSEQPPAYRDEQMRRAISRLMKDAPNGPPRVFVGPAPDYPAAFFEKKIDGQAVVRLRVTTRGEVREVSLRSATAPEFGEAALAAARLFWFFPRVQGGKAVETEVDLPFKFEPPLAEVE